MRMRSAGVRIEDPEVQGTKYVDASRSEAKDADVRTRSAAASARVQDPEVRTSSAAAVRVQDSEACTRAQGPEVQGTQYVDAA
jgi:hypothetical protein